MSDLRRDYFATRLVDIDDNAPAALSSLVTETTAEARARFVAEGVEAERLRFRPLARCRYQNQEHAVEVALTNGEIDRETLAKLVADFHEAYEREYTYRLKAPVEIVGLHLVATAEIEKLAFAEELVTGATLAGARKGERIVDYFEDKPRLAAIYDATRLEPGMTFEGPAIIEDPGTTIVVHPGQHVSIDRFGNTHIAIVPGTASGGAS